MKKNIYIVGFLFLTFVFLGGSKVYGATVPCSNGENVQSNMATNYCLQYLINVLTRGTDPTSTPNSKLTISSMPTVAISSVQPSFVDISSSLSPNVFNYLKDSLLADFVFKFVMIFGVGYLVGNHIFKR
jgi:hypothetical protein